ncbi:uncharacterized protein LOC116347237 [Contarinia nasturtii]|uniref:uncharacterized protein LOC116347237 n=1 Tax=Contarinia nasturtii TaxID=265458 RepID=UPI0012D47046|nr:uncharacterized protein LOC116347237 [Contarinia nasturtii]
MSHTQLNGLDWKSCAKAMGWLGIIVYAIICFALGFFGLICSPNLIASAFWLYGISSKRANFMLAALIVWSISLLILLCLFAFYGYGIFTEDNINRRENTANLFIASTVFGISLIYYIFCVNFYRKFKQTIDEMEKTTWNQSSEDPACIWNDADGNVNRIYASTVFIQKKETFV